MSGWNLKNGELNKGRVIDDEYWSLLTSSFPMPCMKRNTYKFGLIKSIMDNPFNCILEDEDTIYR